MGYSAYFDSIYRALLQVYYGNSEIRAMYVGNQLVWEKNYTENMALTINAGYIYPYNITVTQNAENTLRTFTWGDGTSTTTTADSVNHTYPAGNVYQLTISDPAGGRSNSSYSIISSKALTAINSFGSAYMHRNGGGFITAANAFQGNTKLASINCDWSGLRFATNTSNMFNGCSGLVIIPATWIGLIAANTSYMFRNCSSLVTLPSTWDGLATSDATGMFYGCTGITSLPSWSNLNVASAPLMFYGCTGITTVSTEGLSGLANITNTTNMFGGCSGITSDLYPIYEYLSTKTIPVTSYTGTFAGCVNATNWDLIPSSWGGGAN